MGEENNSSNKNNSSKYLLAIIVVVLVIGAILYFKGSKDTTNITPGSPVQIEIGNSAVMGSVNAIVTIIEFSDFQCPFCGRNFRQTYPFVKKEYIDTGKVRYSFKDYPLSFHEQAQKAAETAKCVREQLGDEGFWKMHDKLYENQQDLSIETEKKLAREVGVDGEKFDKCLDSGAMKSAVDNEFEEGKAIGVEGTPAFFINGKPLIGACPFDSFQKAIDAEIAGKNWSVDQCKVNVE